MENCVFFSFYLVCADAVIFPIVSTASVFHYICSLRKSSLTRRRLGWSRLTNSMNKEASGILVNLRQCRRDPVTGRFFQHLESVTKPCGALSCLVTVSHDRTDHWVAQDHVKKDLNHCATKWDPGGHRKQSGSVDGAYQESHDCTRCQALHAAKSDVHDENPYTTSLFPMREACIQTSSHVECTVKDQGPVEWKLPNVRDIV